MDAEVASHRPNPLLSFVITESELGELSKISLEYGVSIAHVARGVFRQGLATLRPTQSFNVALIKLGNISNPLQEVSATAKK